MGIIESIKKLFSGKKESKKEVKVVKSKKAVKKAKKRK